MNITFAVVLASSSVRHNSTNVALDMMWFRWCRSMRSRGCPPDIISGGADRFIRQVGGIPAKALSSGRSSSRRRASSRAAHTLGADFSGRVVQGVGGGALLTVSQAVLLETFPPEEAGTRYLFWPGVMVGPTIRPHARRLDHRQLQLALDFLYQRAARLCGRVHDRRSYVHAFLQTKKSHRRSTVSIALLIVSVASLQYLLEYG